MLNINAPKRKLLFARVAWIFTTLLMASSLIVRGEEASATQAHSLVGQLLVSTSTGSNLKRAVISKSSTIVLQAVITPTTAQPATLTKDVTFYEGTKVVGTAALIANRTTARLTLSNVPVGTHAYTALYPSDGIYDAYSFPSVTVAVQDNPDIPALVSAYVVAKNNAATIAPNGTLQFTAYGSYSDGSTGELPDAQGNSVTLWNTTNHKIAKISTLGHATATGTGSVLIEATIASIKATPWMVTVQEDSTPPSLVSAYVLANGSVKSMPPGGALQFTAYGKYADGSVSPLPDAYGNEVTAWSTSNDAIAKITDSGFARATALGAVSVEALVGSLSATPWPLTVEAPDPLSVTCATNPAVVDPGGSTLITATAASASNLPLVFHYTASAGTISEAGTIAKLQTPEAFVGTVNVTCTAEEEGGISATGNTTALVSNSSGNLVASNRWKGEHDEGTPGSANGSTKYPVSIAGTASTRSFSVDYSARGGERYSISFGHDTTATHFVYDASVYIEDPTQLANLEMDMNQVTSNGETVIYGTQCSGYSKTWQYTTATIEQGSAHPHWVSSKLACDPATWEAHTWHHVQIASSRNSAGVVSYDWVTLDGVSGVFDNAIGPSSFGLGWPVGDLLLNFQLDGTSKASGSIVAYLDGMTIYSW